MAADSQRRRARRLAYWNGLSRSGESEGRRQPEPDATRASFARRRRGDMSVPRPLDVPPQVKKTTLVAGAWGVTFA